MRYAVPNDERIPDIMTSTGSTRETDTYPQTVVTVTVASYENDGAQYTLVFPDGSTREIGDAQEDYMVLADVVDRAWERQTR
jgi:hypothetical protein